jgi:hypothetical protein
MFFLESATGLARRRRRRILPPPIGMFTLTAWIKNFSPLDQ